MALSKEDILNAIAAMSVMDVVELVKAMEDKFGVSAAAAVAAAPAAAADQGAVLARVRAPAFRGVRANHRFPDQVGLDRDQIEERRRKIGALIILFLVPGTARAADATTRIWSSPRLGCWRPMASCADSCVL